jgi:hypothetical protein
MPRKTIEEYPFFGDVFFCLILISGESGDSGLNPGLKAEAKPVLFSASSDRL